MRPTQTLRAFNLLGIAPTEDQAEIRRAWRASVRTYHPDLAKEDRAAANRRLAEINEAFDLLIAASSERKRRKPIDPRQAEAVKQRMAAARRAEARRQAEARQAEAERRAHAAREAEKRAAEEAAKRAQEAQAREEAARAAAARAAAAREVQPCPSNPTVECAVRAFANALAIFSAAPVQPTHNTTY